MANAADGTGASRVGPGDSPLLSHDGTRVAASRFAAHGSTVLLYGPGIATHGLFDAAKFSSQPLAWSPDDRYLAVALFPSSAPFALHSSIVVIDVTTGAVQTIARGNPCGASFSPSLPDTLVYSVAARTDICRPGRVNLYIRN